MTKAYAVDKNYVQSKSQRSMESQTQAKVHSRLFLEAGAPGSLAPFFMQEQVTSSRLTNGTGGSLVH